MHTRQLRRLSVAAIIGLTIVTAAGCSDSGTKTAKPVAAKKAAPVGSEGSYHGPTIVVAGTGEIKGTPDTVTLSMGVHTTGPSAVEALNSNNLSASTLIDTLKQKGVRAKNIQTSDLSVSPTYDKYGVYITGYSVFNSVTVTMYGVQGAGAIIDAAANAVGDAITFNGISLSIGDNSSRSLIAQARAAAVKQAINHAKQLAAAAGLTLGAVRKIDDTGTAIPPPQYYAADGLAMNRAAVPLEPGTQQLSVDVSVTFAVSS